MNAAPQATSAPTHPQIAVGNTATREGKERWQWTVFLLGQNETLRRVQCVEYLLHPTFADPRRSVCNRGNIPGRGFPLTAEGSGTFSIGVKVTYRDGQVLYLRHQLRFVAEAEGWQLVPSTPGSTTLTIPVTGSATRNGHFDLELKASRSTNGAFTLDYEGLIVRDFGIRRTGRWIFDVLVNEESVWTLILNANNESPSSPRPTAVRRDIPPEGAVSVRVLAHREN